MKKVGRIIVLFAYPCAGKDVHSERLGLFFDGHGERFVCINTGEKIRSLKKGNYTAKIIKKTVEKGSLVPDFIPEWIVGESLLRGLTEGKHIILNGFPRSLYQAKTLLRIANFYNRRIEVVFIKITQKEALRRVEKRRNQGRSDDSEESIKKRFKIFRQKKKSLLPFFKSNCELIRIDGRGTRDEVDLKIFQALGLVSNQGDLFK